MFCNWYTHKTLLNTGWDDVCRHTRLSLPLGKVRRLPHVADTSPLTNLLFRGQSFVCHITSPAALNWPAALMCEEGCYPITSTKGIFSCLCNRERGVPSCPLPLAAKYLGLALQEGLIYIWQNPIYSIDESLHTKGVSKWFTRETYNRNPLKQNIYCILKVGILRNHLAA